MAYKRILLAGIVSSFNLFYGTDFFGGGSENRGHQCSEDHCLLRIWKSCKRAF